MFSLFGEKILNREKLHIINLRALECYTEHLMFTPSLIHYLLDKRKFDLDTIKLWKLGYGSPTVYNSLNQSLGISKKEFYEASLPQFENRLIFPLFNEYNHLIGFGGRRLSNSKEEAKYVNTYSNSLYQKSKFLYGLNLTKEHIIKEKKCYLVEGYTDVMRMYMKDFKNVAGIGGTSFTLQQAYLLSQYCNEVIICLDNDEAGHKAALRAVEILLMTGIEISICILSPDPDSYLKDFRFRTDGLIPSPPVKMLFRLVHDEKERIDYISKWIKKCINKNQANELLKEFYKYSSKSTRKSVQTLFNNIK